MAAHTDAKVSRLFILGQCESIRATINGYGKYVIHGYTVNFILASVIREL